MFLNYLEHIERCMIRVLQVHNLEIWCKLLSDRFACNSTRQRIEWFDHSHSIYIHLGILEIVLDYKSNDLYQITISMEWSRIKDWLQGCCTTRKRHIQGLRYKHQLQVSFQHIEVLDRIQVK